MHYYPDEEYLDFLDDPEFYREWHAPENQVTHTCEQCGQQFTANRNRGDLAFCEGCADRNERC